MRHQGSCHCGAVQFSVDAPETITVQSCNCSLCEKLGYIHLIVPKSAFNLTHGKDNLTTYTFNTGVAQHYFCQSCGVKSFYVPRSNPDGYSINFRCLDRSTIKDVVHEAFDGQNWEQNAASLSHLSRDIV
ncbi:MAG: GFA family protein [Algicola sp.]|nr:GFA family protein [Algicola sp.]